MLFFIAIPGVTFQVSQFSMMVASLLEQKCRFALLSASNLSAGRARACRIGHIRPSTSTSSRPFDVPSSLFASTPPQSQPGGPDLRAAATSTGNLPPLKRSASHVYLSDCLFCTGCAQHGALSVALQHRHAFFTQLGTAKLCRTGCR